MGSIWVDNVDPKVEVGSYQTVWVDNFDPFGLYQFPRPKNVWNDIFKTNGTTSIYRSTMNISFGTTLSFQISIYFLQIIYVNTRKIFWKIPIGTTLSFQNLIYFSFFSYLNTKNNLENTLWNDIVVPKFLNI